MITLYFDGYNFVTMRDFIDYVVAHYGSLSQVPEGHPAIGLVRAVHIINTDSPYFHWREAIPGGLECVDTESGEPYS